MRWLAVIALMVFSGCGPIQARPRGSALEAISRVPTDIDGLFKEFQDPSPWYRIQFLLRTNDEVTPEEIECQVRSIREQGGGGVFSYCEHLQEGSPEKFLTDWWWKVVDYTATACAKEGVLYWAYDEEDWPSGTAGGRLLEQHPELTWKYIRPKEQAFKGPVAADIPVGDEPFVAAVAFQLDGKELKPETLTSLSTHLADGHVRWQVPAGDWTVAVYTAGTGKVWNSADYPDLMSHDAGKAFVDLVYRAHDDRVRPIPGASVTGYFTDEPSMTVANYPAGKIFPWVPAMPYSRDLPEAFRRQHGYDWQTSLPLLYHEAGPRTVQFRCHHWQTCNRLYAENYFGQIYRFCDQRGQIASGHVHVEESLMAHLTLQGGNILNLFRCMHTPGIDWIYPFENALPSLVPKYVSSVAHLDGRTRAWCESFAACGWGLTFQQMRRIVNWEHVNGISMQIPICYKYSLRGAKRAQFYTPGISYQQPYWDHFKAFADYEARLCALVAGDGHVAQVALAYPSADLWTHCWEHDLLNARSVNYTKLSDAIRDAGYDYDVLDDQAIQKQARIEGASLKAGSERFGLLVLSQVDTVSRPTLERAIELATAGGTVLVQGGLPRHSIEAGGDDPEVARLLHKLLGASCREQAAAGKAFWHEQGKGRAGFAPHIEGIVPMLHRAATPDLLMEAGSEGLYAYHRRLRGGDLYLIMNRRDVARTAQVTLSVSGHPEKWNPMTGRAEGLNEYQITPQGTRLTLQFAPDEIVPIVLRREPVSGQSRLPSTVVAEIPIPGPFQFSMEQTMARPHVAWNFAEDTKGWHLATQPAILPTSQPAGLPSTLPPGDWSKLGLANFSGICHYQTDVALGELPAGTKVILDLGKVAVSARVRLNGQDAGIAFLEPYELDVTPFVKPGTNRLEIAVANTLANYYGQFKELTEAPLHAGGVRPEHKVSGLLGPVTLRVMR